MRENADLKRNLTDVERMIKTLEKKQKNHTITCQEIHMELDGKMNKSFSNYQLIFKDLLQKHKKESFLFEDLNRSMAEIGTKFHDLSFDFEKKLAVLNSSVVSKYM